VVAYGVNDVIKVVVAEPRPCYAYPRDFLLEHCPPVSDYAFPSNHSVVAAAMAAALFLISWRLGVLAVLATALMGFSRVYVGAHYPHDVIAGLLVGVLVGLPTAVLGAPLREPVRREAAALWKTGSTRTTLRASPLDHLLVCGCAEQ